MALMQQVGVQRAQLALQAARRGRKPDNIAIVRRLYFRQFDGSGTQITDETTLQRIAESGLKAELDRVARARVMSAPLTRGVDMPLHYGKRLETVVEFFSTPVLTEQSVWLSPSGKSPLLSGSVMEGDVASTKELLATHSFSKRELDRALFDAAISRYDNSDVIELLVRAGASVNARDSTGGTPLMNAVSRPCNLRPLLDAGSDANARDKWGRTALEIARENKVHTSIEILEEAAGRASPVP